jgi:alkanesulfonate monooxygenase SsuD/methylene tetrahydromethanopterin reductase-like flavin-dependent oxidoreductase (luciferase family)
VTPVQRPHPPLWVAILRAEAARHVGAKGRSVMLIPYATCASVDDLGPIAAEHRAGVASSVEPVAKGGRREVAAALHAYVSSSPDGARAECEPYLDRYVGSRLYASRRGYDEVLDAGLLLAGDPDTVAAQLGKVAGHGVDHVLLLANFGAMPHELVVSSLTTFAREVMPRFETATTRPSP